jgi:hypothetical protein
MRRHSGTIGLLIDKLGERSKAMNHPVLVTALLSLIALPAYPQSHGRHGDRRHGVDVARGWRGGTGSD